MADGKGKGQYKKKKGKRKNLTIFLSYFPHFSVAPPRQKRIEGQLQCREEEKRKRPPPMRVKGGA